MLYASRLLLKHGREVSVHLLSQEYRRGPFTYGDGVTLPLELLFSQPIVIFSESQIRRFPVARS